jgi:hypothetical protein
MNSDLMRNSEYDVAVVDCSRVRMNPMFDDSSTARSSADVSAPSRSNCLSALRAIEDDMEAALEDARRARAGHCLGALRALLSPFELGRHEIRISANSDFTCLDVRVRSPLSDGDARQLSKLHADGVVLDVLQEIDEFLQDHEEWTRLLDGEILNP